MDLLFMLFELISSSEGYSARCAFDAVRAHAGSQMEIGYRHFPNECASMRKTYIGNAGTGVYDIYFGANQSPRLFKVEGCV